MPAASALPSVGRNCGSISAVTGENERSPTRSGRFVYANAPIDANVVVRLRHSAMSVSRTTGERWLRAL